MHSTKKVSSVWQIGVICGFHILHRSRESAWPQETEKEPEPTIAHLLHLWPEKANNLAIFFYMKLEHAMHGWLSVCESFLQNARAALACLSMLQNLGEATENAALEFYVCKPLMRKRTCINQHLIWIHLVQAKGPHLCAVEHFPLDLQTNRHYMQPSDAHAWWTSEEITSCTLHYVPNITTFLPSLFSATVQSQFSCAWS